MQNEILQWAEQYGVPLNAAQVNVLLNTYNTVGEAEGAYHDAFSAWEDAKDAIRSHNEDRSWYTGGLPDHSKRAERARQSHELDRNHKAAFRERNAKRKVSVVAGEIAAENILAVGLDPQVVWDLSFAMQEFACADDESLPFPPFWVFHSVAQAAFAILRSNAQ